MGKKQMSDAEAVVVPARIAAVAAKLEAGSHAPGKSSVAAHLADRRIVIYVMMTMEAAPLHHQGTTSKPSLAENPSAVLHQLAFSPHHFSIPRSRRQLLSWVRWRQRFLRSCRTCHWSWRRWSPILGTKMSQPACSSLTSE